MRNDFLVLEDGAVRVTDMAMEIPSFKDFKRYDNSTNKRFFQYAMNYIYYVYQIYGDDASYLAEMSLLQRKQSAVKHHTGPYKRVDEFEGNKHLVKCIQDYLRYSRTASENLLDELKEDIALFLEEANMTPRTIKEKIKVERANPDNPDEMIPIEFYVEVPYVKGRINILTEAEKLSDHFERIAAKVKKDSKKKREDRIIFEDIKDVEKITLDPNNISISEET
jgi:hypothetical protein